MEGLGEEFEIVKIAFELEDLKKDKEKRREKIGDFFLSGTDRGFKGGYMYVREEGKRRIFLGAGREDSWIVGRRSTKELEKRAIATKAAQLLS